MNIFIILIVGSLIGWISNLFIYSRNMSVKADIGVGILGAFVGLFIYSTIRDFPLSVWESVGITIVGASFFLLIADFFTARRRLL